MHSLLASGLDTGERAGQFYAIPVLLHLQIGTAFAPSYVLHAVTRSVLELVLD